MRKVQGPQAWERGNIFIETVHPHDSEAGDNINSVVRLADTSLWGAGDTDIARAMSETARAVDIGGIVGYWHTSLDAISTVAVLPIEEFQGFLHWRNLIVGDRVVETTGGVPQPAAVSTNWFTNTSPVSTTHESQDAQQAFPTRIFHQDSGRLGATVALADGPGVGTNLAAFPRLQTVQSGRHAFNLKLRARLEDDQGLYWHFATKVTNVVELTDAELSATCTFIGTIFYRVRF